MKLKLVKISLKSQLISVGGSINIGFAAYLPIILCLSRFLGVSVFPLNLLITFIITRVDHWLVLLLVFRIDDIGRVFLKCDERIH